MTFPGEELLVGKQAGSDKQTKLEPASQLKVFRTERHGE